MSSYNNTEMILVSFSGNPAAGYLYSYLVTADGDKRAFQNDPTY